MFEESSGKTSGGAAVASLFSRLRYRRPETLALLNYNIGYKAHHRMDGMTGGLVAGDVLVNRLDADLRRALPAGWSVGGGGELKTRSVYRKNMLNLLSEEGYVRGDGELTAGRSLPGLQAHLELEYRLSFADFRNFHSFDFTAHSPGARLSRRLADNLNLSLGYGFTRRRYRREINRLGEDGELVRLDERQVDRLHRLDAGLGYTGGMLLNFTWSLVRNDSNNYGFSYWNNRFTLLFSDRLPAGVYLNAYLFFEIKRYSDPVDRPLLVDILTEENDNNGAVLKFSRPLTAALEANLTLSAYRNESSVRELNFRKNVAALSLTTRF